MTFYSAADFKLVQQMAASKPGDVITAMGYLNRPVIPERTSELPARSVAGSAGKTLPSRPWRRDWDACSWWTTMR